MEHIRRLVTTGSTILLTTQYLEEADQLADRIAVMDHGRVVAEGTSHQLKARYRQGDPAPGAGKREGRRNNYADNRKDTSAAKAPNPEAALVTAPMADPDRVTDLLVALRETNIHLAGVSVQEPTLDEVFLTLTGTPRSEAGQP